MNLKNPYIVIVAIVMTACGTVSRLPEISDEQAKQEAEKQREIVVEETHRLENRLHRISYPIIRDNVKLCEKKGHRVGLRVAFTNDALNEFKEAFKRFHNLGEHSKIIDIQPGSPGEQAELQLGDEIVAVNGEPAPKEPKAAGWLKEKFFEPAKKGEALTLTVLRKGENVNLTIKPEKTCGYGINLVVDELVNAFADGENVYITSGMMRFTNNDNELALIVGHELGHNTMNHVAKSQGNAIAGALIVGLLGAIVGVDLTQAGAQIGAAAFSQDFEAEADYVGVYYAARAGFNVSDVAKVWRRMAAANPASIHLAGTSHPSSAKRFLAIEKTWNEIREKKVAGLNLRPELENPKAVSTDKPKETVADPSEKTADAKAAKDDNANQTPNPLEGIWNWLKEQSKSEGASEQ